MPSTDQITQIAPYVRTVSYHLIYVPWFYHWKSVKIDRIVQLPVKPAHPYLLPLVTLSVRHYMYGASKWMLCGYSDSNCHWFGSHEFKREKSLYRWQQLASCFSLINLECKDDSSPKHIQSDTLYIISFMPKQYCINYYNFVL